jgi:heme-degrading monooxygenase HmoA
MIYEVRTYTLRPGTVAEFEERYAKRLPLREKHSKLSYGYQSHPLYSPYLGSGYGHPVAG